MTNTVLKKEIEDNKQAYADLYRALNNLVDSTEKKQEAINKLVNVGTELITEHNRGFYRYALGIGKEVNFVHNADPRDKEGFKRAEEKGKNRLERKLKILGRMLEDREYARAVLYNLPEQGL